MPLIVGLYTYLWYTYFKNVFLAMDRSKNLFRKKLLLFKTDEQIHGCTLSVKCRHIFIVNILYIALNLFKTRYLLASGIPSRKARKLTEFLKIPNPEFSLRRSFLFCPRYLMKYVILLWSFFVARFFKRC